MLYHSEEEKPIVLVVSETDLFIPKMTTDFLKSNSLDVELVNLDQSFFLEYEKIAKQIKRVYKIIFIYGFHSNSQDLYLRIFDFFDLLNEQQKENIPIILISPFTTTLDILDDFVPEYKKHLKNQATFLKDFILKFNRSLVFLSQDILINNKKISHPLLLFFSAIKQGYLFDLQAKFYFQDELSFFNLIKDHLIKPHHSAKFVIKGSSLSSAKLLKNITYLYEQYFQKKLLLVELFSDEKKPLFLQEFAVVNNSRVQIENLIDQKIRDISKSDSEISLTMPSEANIIKALEMNKLHKIREQEKELAIKGLEEKESKQVLDLINQAHKEPQKEPEDVNSSSEFATKIESLFSTQRKQAKKARQVKNISQGKEIIKKSKKRKILFWIGTVGFGLGSVFIGLFFLFNASYKNLQHQLFNSVKNKGDGIENIDKSVLYSFFNFQLNQYSKIFSEENLSDALDVRRLNDSLASLFESKNKNQKIAYDLYKKTLEGGVELKQSYGDLALSTDEKIEKEKIFNSYLMSLNLDLYQGEERTVWQSSLNTNKTALRDALQFKRFFTSFRDLMLSPGRVNFLILIQDSSEIRSTGGFLTEVILLSFDNAVLVDKQILDVNDLDSRIYGRKESNQEIKDILGENSLYLRDSNWQADFVKSSQEIAWFVEQITGSKIDLTLALNTKTIAELLRVLDGVDLGENLLINASNYLERQEKTASLDYKNIGDEKFTWQFAKALFKKTLELNGNSFAAFSNLLTEHLNQREILIQTSNQGLQQAIEANSWSGKKIGVICPAEFKQENCLLDSLYQVENNVGINKVNPYIRETIEHNLGISKDFIRHKRKITFENFSKTDIWPLGAYRNYLKFYLNPEASLEKIEINSQKLEEQRIKIVDTVDGKEISVLLEIPKQSKIELSITYLVPNKMNPPFSYVFFDQKQPGIFSKKTNYNIVFDEQFKPQLIAPQAIYQDKTIRFENDNLDHFLFAINFSE
jgi:hypothetical protein